MSICPGGRSPRSPGDRQKPEVILAGRHAGKLPKNSACRDWRIPCRGGRAKRHRPGDHPRAGRGPGVRRCRDCPASWRGAVCSSENGLADGRRDPRSWASIDGPAVAARLSAARCSGPPPRCPGMRPSHGGGDEIGGGPSDASARGRDPRPLLFEHGSRGSSLRRSCRRQSGPLRSLRAGRRGRPDGRRAARAGNRGGGAR